MLNIRLFIKEYQYHENYCHLIPDIYTEIVLQKNMCCVYTSSWVKETESRDFPPPLCGIPKEAFFKTLYARLVIVQMKIKTYSEFFLYLFVSCNNFIISK